MPVSFNLGTNTKVDPKQLQGGLIELENAYQTRTGELRMRNGYDEFSTATVGAPTDPFENTVVVNAALGLATFNDELLLFAPDTIYSWAPQIEKWSYKGSIIFTDVSSTAVIANSYEQTSLDMGITRGIAVYSWEDSRGGVYAKVTDLDSGATLIAERLLNADGIRPRCFGIGQYLFVYYYDTVNLILVAQRVDTTDPTGFSGEVTVADDINTTTPIFDVGLVGTSLMVVAYRDTSNQLRLAYFLQSNQVGTTLLGVPDPTSFPAIDPDQALTVYHGENANDTPTFHVAWVNSATGVAHIAFYVNFEEYLPELVLDAYSTTARNITGVAYDIYTDVYWETPAASVLDYYITGTWIDTSDNTANTGDPPQVIQRSAGLASKAYHIDGALTSSVIVSHETENRIQNTYFAVNNELFVFGNPATEGSIEAKILPNAAGGHTNNYSDVPGVWLVDGLFYFPTGRQTRLIVGASTTFSLIGFNQTILNYSSPRVGLASQLGQNLFIPGGYVQAFDGVSATEQNFHLYPETPTATDGYAGDIADGSYEYIVIWEWIDGEGQIFQSATSIPLNFEVTAGPKQVDLTIPTLRYTDKKIPTRTPVIISVYRTEDGGTLFYKVTDDTDPTYNDVLVDSIVFTDNISDADLISRPLLYTTGGILDNGPSPAATIVRTAKNRLFSAGLENGNQIAYSKEYVVNESINFAAEFTIQVDARGGRITALAEMDEKLVIFKESAMLYLTGDGPDDTGANGQFTITPIATDVGTIEPESVVLMPDGLMFKSKKGIWLLSRGLQTEYVGADVQQYNDLNVSSAVVVPDLNQVRFTTTAGTTMMYDYYYKKWSTFSNQAAVAAINWQTNYLFAHADGLVWQENRESYADNNVPIIPKIGTQWFDWAQIQGFQRVQRCVLLGEYRGPHNLKVSVYYDYENSPREVFYYNMANNDYGTTYGSTSPYGAPVDVVYGTLDGIYQFQIDFERQRCQALRLVIEGVFPESDGTPAFTLSAVTFLVATKKGTMRLPYTKSMTSS